MNKFLEKQVEHGKEVRNQILIFIMSYFIQHYYPPSYVEISDAVGIKVSNVKRHMDKLFDEGLLETDLPDRYHISRAYRVTRNICNMEVCNYE